MWNTNWQETNTSFSAAWVDAHNAAAAELGKPLLLEEVRVIMAGSAQSMQGCHMTVRAVAMQLQCMGHRGSSSVLGWAGHSCWKS